jgi:AbrB family looped-hinge helix DNA binding protein
MYTMSITQKGQLVIPKELRERHGIRPNSSVLVTEIEGHIAILTAVDPLRRGRGMLKLEQSTERLLKEARRAEFEKDKRMAARSAPGKPRNARK